MVSRLVCAVAVLMAFGLTFRFRHREAWLTAQAQASSAHQEELKGVLAVHLGEAAEIANRLREFLPDIDGGARPRADEAIGNLVRTLDILTVTLREPGSSS